MHSWASYYLLIVYVFSSLSGIAQGAKKSGAVGAVIFAVVYIGMSLLTTLVVLPTGGFVW